MTDATPRQQGAACFYEHGENSKDRNPHPPNSNDWREWNRGWEDAEYTWGQYFHAYGRGWG